MITGESKPVRRGEGDTVVAGTVATDSGVRVEITAVGDDTALAGIQRLVTEAQNSSSRAQRIADRAAALLFWFALVAGIITAIVWTFEGQARGISRMIDYEAYCIDILTQISAATSALESVALGLLGDHLRHCVADAAGTGGLEAKAKIAEASQAIARLVRS